MRSEAELALPLVMVKATSASEGITACCLPVYMATPVPAPATGDATGSMYRLVAVFQVNDQPVSFTIDFLAIRHGRMMGGFVYTSINAPPNAELLKEPKVEKYLKVLVEELKQNTGKSVVIAGRRQPPEVHALVARINQAIMGG